jgi:hypothetical protein
MAIGNQPTVTSVNNDLSNYATQMRNLMQQVQEFNLEVAALGTTGLETVGFNATDAANVVSTAAIMNTVSAVYFGTATQATLYNFNNALAGLWAGQ